MLESFCQNELQEQMEREDTPRFVSRNPLNTCYPDPGNILGREIYFINSFICFLFSD